METVEDVREVLEDSLAPELRAISTCLDSMDDKMDVRLNAVDVRFQIMRAEIVQVRQLLDLDRRLARLESR